MPPLDPPHATKKCAQSFFASSSVSHWSPDEAPGSGALHWCVPLQPS
jgi:hypothetical protein